MILENNDTCSLDSCLIVPVAAKSIQSIEKYVGEITMCSKNEKYLFVDFEPLAQKNNLPIWQEKRAEWIHIKRQCWVHVDYTGYRKCYKSCYEELGIGGMVIDHIMNRRFARQLGYNYIRLIHVDRSVNSSSGRGQEYDVINYNNPKGLKKFKVAKNEISYADPSDLLKILNEKVGSFPLDNLRDKLYLFYP